MDRELLGQTLSGSREVSGTCQDQQQRFSTLINSPFPPGRQVSPPLSTQSSVAFVTAYQSKWPPPLLPPALARQSSTQQRHRLQLRSTPTLPPVSTCTRDLLSPVQSAVQSPMALSHLLMCTFTSSSEALSLVNGSQRHFSHARQLSTMTLLYRANTLQRQDQDTTRPRRI
jgi:hypothetical protein